MQLSKLEIQILLKYVDMALKSIQTPIQANLKLDFLLVQLLESTASQTLIMTTMLASIIVTNTMDRLTYLLRYLPEILFHLWKLSRNAWTFSSPMGLTQRILLLFLKRIVTMNLLIVFRVMSNKLCNLPRSFHEPSMNLR